MTTANINISTAAGFDKQAHHGEHVDDIIGERTWGSITLDPRSGNEEPTVWINEETGASYNAVSLRNQGIGPFVATDLPMIARRTTITKQRLSLAPTGKGTLQDMLNALKTSTFLSCLFEIEINGACPNTRNGENLEPVLAHDLVATRELLEETVGWDNRVPLVLKIAPNTPVETLEGIVKLCCSFGFKGIVSGNTRICTTPVVDGAPCLSVDTCGEAGATLFNDAIRQFRLLQEIISGESTQLELIACGGTTSREQMYEYMEAGAHRIQLGTYYYRFGARGLQDMQLALP